MAKDTLLDSIRRQYRLEWNGVHGFRHWVRVRENGRRLAAETRARRDVIDLFAFLHDACRLNEGEDPGHGPRAADLARSLQGAAFDLDAHGVELLVIACRDHTQGLMHDDSTIATCWDADQLDLWRVGTRPDPKRLCTEAARDPAVIEWACRRAEESW